MLSFRPVFLLSSPSSSIHSLLREFYSIVAIAVGVAIGAHVSVSVLRKGDLLYSIIFLKKQYCPLPSYIQLFFRSHVTSVLKTSVLNSVFNPSLISIRQSQ